MSIRRIYPWHTIDGLYRGKYKKTIKLLVCYVLGHKVQTKRDRDGNISMKCLRCNRNFAGVAIGRLIG